MSLNYFAYGSNMSLARMVQRVPSACWLGTFVLADYRLCFHKAGRDGSAKCDALWTGKAQDQVIGVAYTIDPQHKQELDLIEGLGAGYATKQIVVMNPAGEPLSAFTYCATHIDASLLPYSWYLEHVLTGAREASVPEHYRQRFLSPKTMDDPDRQRDKKERVIYRQIPPVS